MTELVALLSTGKGTWSKIGRLIKSQPWEKVFLITNEFGAKFTAVNTELIVVNLDNGALGLRDEIFEKLKGKINGIEVAVNMSSGSGNEHMALIGALIKLGVGIRIVGLGDKGYTEI